jgi:Anticodon binding domain of methionyl tRNA ligase
VRLRERAVVCVTCARMLRACQRSAQRLLYSCAWLGRRCSKGRNLRASGTLCMMCRANVLLEETAPWSTIKKGSDEEKAAAAATLVTALEAARVTAVLLAPVTPDLSCRLLRQLGLEASTEVRACTYRCLCVGDNAKDVSRCRGVSLAHLHGGSATRLFETSPMTCRRLHGTMPSGAGSRKGRLSLRRSRCFSASIRSTCFSKRLRRKAWLLQVHESAAAQNHRLAAATRI